MLKFLKYICQLILSPGNGWEDISHAGEDHKQLIKTRLFPIFGVAAISVFIQMFYDFDLEFVLVLQQAIVIFVQFFLTYFIATLVFAITMPSFVDGEPNEKKYTTVIIYSLAIIALITIFQNCVPVELSLVPYLKIYVAIVLWKSVRYLAIKEQNVKNFVIMAALSIILPPMIINAIFDFIIQ
ncbi:MAG: hypothetical protein E7081_06315 [Bacteroidales bacterium]|nr:hypothetical protein [Bacteroidales bacterium]